MRSPGLLLGLEFHDSYDASRFDQGRGFTIRLLALRSNTLSKGLTADLSRPVD